MEDLERLKNALPSLWASLQLPNNLKVIPNILDVMFRYLIVNGYILGRVSRTANTGTTSFLSEEAREGN